MIEETSRTLIIKCIGVAIVLMGCTGSNRGVEKVEQLDGGTVDAQQIERSIEDIMKMAGVTGLSCAILKDSHVVYERGFGLRKSDSSLVNDAKTVFNAASFSKTVFASLVMMLEEEGTIDLDRPLQDYLEDPLPEYPEYADLEGDDRASQITARMVLSHSTGFPNLRFLTEDGKLKFLFDPGARFSYSGEGIGLLQEVIEEITGRDLEELCQKRIFGPFGMERTSYVWQDRFEDNHACGHDRYGRSMRASRRKEANAIGSMVTTAGDYARFMEGLLTGESIHRNTVSRMFEPQIAIASRSMFGPGAFEESGDDEEIRLSWALGFGFFESEYGRAVFHTGHDLGGQNYTVTFLDLGLGAVLLSNSDNFESVARELFEVIVGDTVSPFDWLGYPHFDPEMDRTPPKDPVAVNLAPEVLGRYVGEYGFIQRKTLEIRLEHRTLIVSDDGENWRAIYPESELLFFSKERPYKFLFEFDETGNVTGFTFLLEDIEVRGERIGGEEIER
jgi:CubicO group peptidase (beta-lactamase class C family)